MIIFEKKVFEWDLTIILEEYYKLSILYKNFMLKFFDFGKF